jgi:hypothetical protein
MVGQGVGGGGAGGGAQRGTWGAPGLAPGRTSPPPAPFAKKVGPESLRRVIGFRGSAASCVKTKPLYFTNRGWTSGLGTRCCLLPAACCLWSGVGCGWQLLKALRAPCGPDRLYLNIKYYVVILLSVECGVSELLAGSWVLQLEVADWVSFGRLQVWGPSQGPRPGSR